MSLLSAFRHARTGWRRVTLLSITAGLLPVSGAALAAEGSAAPPEPRVVSLEDSIAIAMQHSRAIAAAEERLRQAQAQIGIAKAPSNLQTRIDGTVTRVDRKSTISIPGPTGVQSVTTGSLYSRSASMGISQAIDISGGLRASRRLARSGADIAALDLERTREQTTLDVKTAFYQVLRAQAGLSVAQATVASLEEHLRQVLAFYEAGTVAQYDVLKAEAQVANARQGEIAARNAVDLAKAALNNTMGIDVATPLQLTHEEPVRIIRPDYQESLALAYERRVEVQQADENVDLAQAGVSLAQAGARPTLGVGANINWNGDTTAFNPRAVQWNASAVISYPLLDGGLARSRVDEARANVAGARVTQEEVREGVALEVQQAILSLREAAERMEAADRNVTQAAEALRLAKLQYREGLTTAIEVTDAQALLTQAESNQVNARYDYLVAQARFERATGADAVSVEGGAAAALQPAANPEEEKGK